MLTVGKLLRIKRTEKGINLKQAEKQTRIRYRYLDAIENENWHIFSSRVYITGAIQSYASYLGIDPQKALAYFRRDYEKQERAVFKKRIPRLHLLPETRKLVIGVMSFLFIVFFIYFGYQINLFLSPPGIKILSPQKNIFRNIEKINIKAQTKKESVITIFGEDIFPDKDGNFEYDFFLKKGKNELSIRIVGPNGKVTQHRQEYILE